MACPEPNKHASKMIMPDPSGDAQEAIFACLRDRPLPFDITMSSAEYKERSMRLLIFLIDEFDTKLGLDDINTSDVFSKKPGTTMRLVNELSEKGCKYDFQKTKDYDAFSTVISWLSKYNNRKLPREDPPMESDRDVPQDLESDGGTGCAEDADVESSEDEDNMDKRAPEFPKEYLKRALDKIKNLPHGSPHTLDLDDTCLPESLRFPSRSANLKRPPLEKIAQHMLSTTIEKQPQRYSHFLEQSTDMYGTLLAALTPATKAVLNKDFISVDDLISIGGSPERDEGPGIYLHVLRLCEQPITINEQDQDCEGGKLSYSNPHHKVFYLYVGQANVLGDRITKGHENLEFRRLHPSLHYRVWDSLEKMGECESVFVKLAGFKRSSQDGPTRSDQLLWNLEEMFMSSVFQTLREGDLNIWLPDDVEKPWAGRHLNLALPLWQGYASTTDGQKMIKMGKTEFHAALTHEDPLIQNWAINVRDAYRSLRDHPDPKMRDIWFTGFRNFEEAREMAETKAYAAWQRRAQENFSDFLFSGRVLRIFQGGWGYYHVTVSDFNFSLRSIPRYSLQKHIRGGRERGEVQGKTVTIKPLLLECPCPLRYAQLSLETDPSS